MSKRPYSREWTPGKAGSHSYLIDRIPMDLWKAIKAKSKKEKISVRAFILTKLNDYVREK